MDMKFPIGFLPQVKEKSEEEYKNAFTPYHRTPCT